MKTSTGIGSSLVLYCLQRPSRTYPQTPLGCWRRRLKATVDKKRNWGVREGALETLVHKQENQHDRWKRLAHMNPKTLRSCLQLTSAQAWQRVDSVSRRLRDCSVGCSAYCLGPASGPRQSFTWHMQRGRCQILRSGRRHRRPTKSRNLSSASCRLCFPRLIYNLPRPIYVPWKFRRRLKQPAIRYKKARRGA